TAVCKDKNRKKTRRRRYCRFDFNCGFRFRQRLKHRCQPWNSDPLTAKAIAADKLMAGIKRLVLHPRRADDPARSIGSRSEIPSMALLPLATSGLSPLQRMSLSIHLSIQMALILAPVSAAAGCFCNRAPDRHREPSRQSVVRLAIGRRMRC
ncbi:MAG: hypothetical protein ACI9WS_003416, partial [Paraglaciecola psychrophila]